MILFRKETSSRVHKWKIRDGDKEVFTSSVSVLPPMGRPRPEAGFPPGAGSLASVGKVQAVRKVKRKYISTRFAALSNAPSGGV